MNILSGKALSGCGNFMNYWEQLASLAGQVSRKFSPFGLLSIKSYLETVARPADF